MEIELFRVRALLADLFETEPEALNGDTFFDELGADEEDLTELHFMCEEEFGLSEAADFPKEMETVNDLLAFLRDQTK